MIWNYSTKKKIKNIIKNNIHRILIFQSPTSQYTSTAFISLGQRPRACQDVEKSDTGPPSESARRWMSVCHQFSAIYRSFVKIYSDFNLRPILMIIFFRVVIELQFVTLFFLEQNINTVCEKKIKSNPLFVKKLANIWYPFYLWI